MNLRMLLVFGVLCVVPLIIAAIVAAVVIFARRRQTAGGPQGDGPSALDILKTRLAQGEITREQYDAMRKDLE